MATWVLTITRNLSIDALRLRGDQPIDPDVLTATLLSREQDESRRPHCEDREQLGTALRAIPPEQGRLIVLSVFYG